jgi:hypothetical protein
VFAECCQIGWQIEVVDSIGNLDPLQGIGGQRGERRLAGGRTLAEVRDAAGHCNVSITSGYLHVAVDDGADVSNWFRLA